MTEDGVKEFYEQVVKPNGYFASEDEFRAVVSDPKQSREFFDNALKAEGLFNDYSEYESTLGLGQKKNSINESTQPLQQGTEGSAMPTTENGKADTVVTEEYGKPAIELKEVEITPKPELGYLQSFMAGIADYDDLQKGYDILQEGNRQNIIDYYNQRYSNKLNNQENSNAVKDFLRMFGGTAPMMGKVATAGITGGAIGSAVPVVGSAIGAAGGSIAEGIYEGQKLSKSSAFEEAFFDAKNQGMPDNEAFEKARRVSNVAQIAGGLEGGASGFAGGTITNVGKSVLKNIAKEIVSDAVIGGSAATTRRIAENVSAQQEGIERDLVSGVGQEFTGEATFAVVVGGLIHSPKLLRNRKKAITAIASTDAPKAISIIDKSVESGYVSVEDGNALKQEIFETAKAFEATPESMTYEERETLTPAVAERQKLQKELEKTDELTKPFIELKINELDKSVAIPLPKKYLDTAGKNTSELKDGQLYITRKGDVRMWDAAQEQFLEAPKTTQVKLGTEVELEPTVTEIKQEPTKEVVTSIESTREPIVSKKEEKIDTKVEKGQVSGEVTGDELVGSPYESIESTAKALEDSDFKTNTPIKGLSVRMSDLRIAEDNLSKGKKSITPNEPIDVTINLTTGNRELSDGYHRYLDARGGTIEKAKTRNLEGSLPAKIKFEINEKGSGFVKTREATNKEISEAYHKAKADGSSPELVKAVEELLGAKTQAKPLQTEVVAEVVTPKVDNVEAAVAETPTETEVVAEDVAEPIDVEVSEEDVAPTETVATEPAPKVNVGSVTYKENSPAQLQGRERTIPIADGTKIKGRYKIVSADDVLASHNEESFAKTENFPTTEDGKTVNDRDYETDKAAQSEVVRIAGKLDSRAVSQTPIVTKDGIVVDGNNRTMSRKLAAKQGTDAEYLAALQADADMYGIDAEQISGVKNPMLVFEAEQEIPYTTKEFARFNKSEKKEKSPIEKAVELSKTVSDKARRVLGDIYEGVETPSEITSNSKNMAKVRDLLVSEGIIQQNELPRYINPETGTATKEGVSFLETLMMGSALNESTIRMLDNEGMGNAKSIVLKSVVQITKNAALGNNSLQPNIENGIKLLNKANQSKQSVVDAISQMDMFEVSQFSAEDLAVAILLDGKGFNDFLKRYNSEVGTESLFEGKLTKEKLIDSLLSQRIKNYEQVRKNIRPDAEGGQAEVQQGDGGVGKEGEGGKPNPNKEELDAAKKSLDENLKAIEDRDAEARAAEEGGRKSERAKRKPKAELTPLELAKQKLQEAKAKAKAIRDSKSNLGVVSDPFEDAKKQAEADREVFDAYVSLGKEYVKAGIKTVEDFAKEIGEELTDTLRNAWDVANGGKKKTLVTERAYEGQFREDVKKELEKIGLTREVASQSEAEKKAADIISTVGVDAALEAVRSGDVKNGDVEAAIYFLSIEELGKQIDKSNDEVEIAALVSKQASILNELGEQQTRAGQFSAIASRFYAESDLGYNSKVQEKKWENQFGEKPSEELMQKWKERDKEFAELDKKLKEAEKRALEAEEKAAMQNIKQSVDNEVVRERKQAQGIYGKTRIAKGLDDLASALGARLSAVGDERAKVSKALADIGQGLIEEGIATARNVGKKLREYLDANFAGKINFDEYEADVISSITGVSTQGGLKVPHSLIRKFVKDGIDNIDDLTTAVHEVVSKSDPSITERQVRDAITGYGKVAHPTKDAIEADIRKMKRVGRIVSALEDIKNKKRPLRSGKQRDAIDAEERRLGKELREAMKDVPADDETKANELRTRLDATKKRVQNQIEDYEGEIARMEALPKNPKVAQEDAELKELRQKRDELKKERDELFKDEEAFERQRLELAKKRAQQRIEDYQRRLKEGDFSKKEVKPIIADDELTKLKAEKLRLKDEYDKEFYKEELRSRTKWEKQKDVLWELWNVPRVLMATGEWSFIGIQGIKQSIAHPTHAVKAFKNAWASMKSEAKTEQFLREIKSQEWYPTLKESKLALTEPNAKLTAREELFYSGWTNTIWDMVGMAVMSPAKFKGEGAFENAMKAWSNANPIKATERAAVGYLDTIRVLRFLDGMQILEMQGKDFASNKEDYKDVADAINTMTGRASLGALDANAELLSKLFFSPRNWASGIKTATPYALIHFGKMTPTARKMALADLSKFLGITTGMVMMVAAQLNNDDDEETSVELDPRSTDFMKIKLGNKRVDPWGGMQQQVVLSSRIIADAIMKGFALAGKESPIEGAIKKDGKLMPLGVPYKTKAAFDLLLQQATNKLNPTASLLYNFAKTKTNKEGAVVDEYGNDYTVSDQLSDKFYPIFWGTAYDLLKEDPSALNGLLTFYAFFGGGILNYEKKEKKSNSRGDQRSSTRRSDQRSSERK